MDALYVLLTVVLLLVTLWMLRLFSRMETER
jgi:hypothetical protein